MLSYVQIYSFEFSGLALAVRLFFQTYCNILKNYLFFRFFNFQVFQPKADAKIMHSFYSIQIF